MADKIDTSLKRFEDAQSESYERALFELKSGSKQSHWMWYIFPQIYSLGFSETSKHYAIKDLKQAEAYLNHPLLGSRLIELCNVLLTLPNYTAAHIFGSPDDMKLRSSMTLFAEVKHTDPVFEKVLQVFFKGEKDQRTLHILMQE